MENCKGNSPWNYETAVFPNKLVKIVFVILQNILSVSGWGTGCVYKILQLIS